MFSAVENIIRLRIYLPEMLVSGQALIRTGINIVYNEKFTLPHRGIDCSGRSPDGTKPSVFQRP
jgi:hypothetical protein